MSTLHARLKKERERLGLSQAVFAEKAGVHRNTQIKYESGERYPSSDYLDAISKIGVDVRYLFSGIEPENWDLYQVAQIELERGIYWALGFSDQEIKQFTFDLMRIIQAEFDAGRACDDDEWILGKRLDFASNILAKSSVLKETAGGIKDAAMLAMVIQQVEDICSRKCIVLSTNKKATLYVMLCRAFAKSGEVDPVMIEDAVTIASQE